MASGKIPATIISGFLGSGKTTLLNRILTSPHGLKVAVLTNEFGAIDIDSSLVVSADSEMVELSNGCICCSMNEGLIAALNKLLGSGTPFEYLVIETTGIADPLPVALTFSRPEFIGRMRVDSILTVADAANFSLDRFDDPAARNQLRYADCVLLNKCDLVDEATLPSVKAKIKMVNPTVRILRSISCDVPLALLLGIGGSEFSDKQESDHHEAPCGPDFTHEHHHAHGFASVSFQGDGAFDPNRFQAFLQALPESVFRAKGFLRVEENPPPFLFNLVGRRFTLEEAADAGENGNRLVFIGIAFDRSALLNDLASCVASPSG